MAIDDRIEELEEKLRETPVNKATEKERARLKSRIAELKEKRERKQEGTGDTSGYAVKQRGDATVALVGFPSVGKSTLLNALTAAESETGSYEFTTVEVEPGMLEYRGAHIQVLDVPGLVGGAAEGRGGGRQVLSVVRSADMLVVVADAEERREEEVLEELRGAGLRPNSEPPRMKVERTGEGGIHVSAPVDGGLEEETMREILEERGYTNARVVVREKMGVDRFVDGLMENRAYMPALKALNKADKLEGGERQELEDDYDLLVSAETGEGLEELKRMIFDQLGLVRVYMKKKGEEPDTDEPMIMRQGDTVANLVEELPGNKQDRFKSARVTGPSSDFPDQEVGEEHELEDEDVVQLKLRHL